MQKFLTISTVAVFLLMASQARAQATALAEIDWSGLTYSTTGAVTFSMERMTTSGPLSTLTSRNGYSWNFLEEVHYVQPDQSASMFNTAVTHGVSLASSSELYGISAASWHMFAIEMDGSGSVTFQIPYVFQLTQEGDFLSRALLAANILNTSDVFAHEAAISSSPHYNFGDPVQSGMFSLTVNGNGDHANYVLYSSVSAQIQPGIPEPETYAMMVLGLTAVFSARRRATRTIS